MSRLFEARESEDHAAVQGWLGALSEPEMEVAVGLLLVADPRVEAGPEREGRRGAPAVIRAGR